MMLWGVLSVSNTPMSKQDAVVPALEATYTNKASLGGFGGVLTLTAVSVKR